jgi:hypothetical protein
MTTAFERFREMQRKAGFPLCPGDRHHAAYEAWNAALEYAASIAEEVAAGRDAEAIAEAIRKETVE